MRSDLTLVVTSAGASAVCGEGPHYVESHDPERLLKFLKGLCEAEAKRTAKKEQQLYREQSLRERQKAS